MQAQALPLEVVTDPSIAAACPSAAAVAARLDAYLAESEVPPGLTARLSVRREADGFAADIELRRDGDTSARSLAGARCPEVLEAAVLVVAIAVDPEVMDRAAPSTASLDPVEEDVAAPVTPPLEPAAALDDPDLGRERGAALDRPARAASPPTFEARIGAALTLGAVPAPAAGAVLEVAVRIDWLEARVGLLWASETAVELEPGRGGSFALYTGLLRLGAVLSIDVLEVVPRVGLDIGAMTGRGIGVATPRFEAAEWIDGAAGLEARIALDLGGLVLGPSLSVELLVPFFRPRFVLNAEDDVFTPPEVGGALALGVWARLG